MSGIAVRYAGGITSSGRFSVFGESDVVFPSNADYTPGSGDTGGYDALSLIVSGLTAPGFNLILPLDKGRPWIIKNTNSVSFTVKGATGSGVLVPANTILFVHSDGTKFEAASAAVDLTSPGPIGGTTPGTVATSGLSGTGTTDDFGGSGDTLSLTSTESKFGSSSSHPVLAGNEGGTTTNATPTAIASFTPANNAGGDWSVTVLGVDVTGGAASGDHYRTDFFFTSVRVGSAAPTLNPASPPTTNTRSSTSIGGGTPTASVSVVSNAINVTVTGVASRTWHWSVILQNQKVT